MDHLKESGAIFCRSIGEFTKPFEPKSSSSGASLRTIIPILISETAIQSDSLPPRLHTFPYISVVQSARDHNGYIPLLNSSRLD